MKLAYPPELACLVNNVCNGCLTLRFLLFKLLYTENSSATISKKPLDITSGPPGEENFSTNTEACLPLSGNAKSYTPETSVDATDADMTPYVSAKYLGLI